LGQCNAIDAQRVERYLARMRTALVLLAALSVSLMGCKPEVHKPSLSVKSAKVSRVDFDQALVDAVVAVENKNAFPLLADRVTYEGFLEGKKVASGQLKRRVQFPASSTQTVKLPIALRYVEVGDALKAMQGKPEWKWEIKGEVAIDVSEELKVSLPFAKSGSLPAPQLPKVRVARAALERVTLTEATAVLEVEIDNPNKFAFPAGSLDAKLKLGEISLDPVKVNVPRIAGGKKKTLKMRQKLRLKNLGAVALKVAGGQPLSAHLVGELNYGSRALPIDLTLELKK
jgi:LEA14-like dessication related protein